MAIGVPTGEVSRRITAISDDGRASVTAAAVAL